MGLAVLRRDKRRCVEGDQAAGAAAWEAARAQRRRCKAWWSGRARCHRVHRGDGAGRDGPAGDAAPSRALASEAVARGIGARV